MEQKRVCDKCHKALRKEDLKPQISVPIVWILGGPGCGKGTQCDKIVERFGFLHISSGDLLRIEMKSVGHIGSTTLASVMETGQLVPTEKVLNLIRNKIYENLTTAKGFLIDGFPRSKDQGILFEETIATPDLILLFDVPSDVMIDRVLQRGRISGRVDDNEESIQKRLITYTECKDELLHHYRGKIKIINATRTVDAIFSDVVPLISPLVD